MLFPATCFGGVATRLPSLPPPAPLPSLSTAFSRRTAIFGAMALGVAPAAAAPAPAQRSDAELLDLLAQHPVAVDRWQAAARAANALERVAIAARPARPAALEHRAGDLGGCGLGLAEVEEPIDEDGAQRRWYGAKAVDWLQHVKPLKCWSEQAQAMVPDLVAEARRAQILVAAEAHAKACSVSDRRMGLTAAEEAVEAAYDALSAIEDRLNGLAPCTLAALAAKAAWAAGSEDEGVMETMLYQVAAFSLAA